MGNKPYTKTKRAAKAALFFGVYPRMGKWRTGPVIN